MNYVTIFSVLTGILFFSCTQSPVDLAGGSTSTPNEIIVGYAFLPDGTPAAQTEVVLVPSSYTTADSIGISDLPTDTTDASGSYRFSGVNSGNFNIQAVHIATRARALVTDIFTSNDTVLAPSAVLHPPGNLAVVLPDSSISRNGTLFIRGTTIAISSDGLLDTLRLDSIPAGGIPELMFTPSNSTIPITLRHNIAVHSGTTSVVLNPSWQYARTIGLNTSASGAGITETLTGFPVCIRLDAMNFDFSQAANDGRDIRFASARDKQLPYEIEQWDTKESHAVIWVNVDTIYENNSTQTITMYWGNADAVAVSSGDKVFDIANGFAGVWHLAETGDIMIDATANNHTGNRFGAQSRTSAQIGYGQRYLHPGDFSDMGNVLNPGTEDLTVSAWIKFNGNGGTYTIVGKSNGGDPTYSNYGWLMTFSFNNLRFMMVSDSGNWGSPGTFWTEANTPLSDTGSWHYVTAVIDRSTNINCRLFMDGTDVSGARLGNIVDVGPVSNAFPLRIGAEADSQFPLRSYLDEVTVSFTTRSADWVKLCYMNQRKDNRLVVFK